MSELSYEELCRLQERLFESLAPGLEPRPGQISPQEFELALAEIARLRQLPWSPQPERPLFQLEDITLLDRRDLQIVLRLFCSDTQTLALALHGADDEVVSTVLDNLPEAVQRDLNEELELRGQRRTYARDVEQARLQIVSTIARLEACGEITIRQSGQLALPV